MVQKLGSNQRIEIHILFPSMECDFPKSVVQFQDLWVRELVLLGNWVQIGKGYRVNVDSKIGTETQSLGSGSHSNSG